MRAQAIPNPIKAVPPHFFEHQDRARRKTSVLIGYFVLSVCLIVLAVYGVFSWLLTVASGDGGRIEGAPAFPYWDGQLFGWVATGTLLVIIAGISLVVGGIGIMNIMLVSVTERTREIGLRKAVGAHKSDILIQFLTESSVLSLIGGLIGIALGWAIAMIVGQIANANNAPINPTIGLDIVLIATIFSTAVGLFFGLYPANRAANLEPVEALRYE